MTKALTTHMKSVKSGLQARRSIYQQMLPRHVSVDRFIRGVLLSCAKNPKLLTCNRDSLFESVGQACQLGLDPSGLLGSAYIVPFKQRATLIPGYRGLIDLARRSGEIQSIQAHVVREGDFFDYQLGDEPKIVHRPNLDTEKPGTVKFAYAVARLKDGGIQREVMTKGEIELIRRRAPGKNSDAWRDHWEEMAKKTVIRRLIKLLPISTEKLLQQAIELDNRAAGEPSPDELLAAFEGGGNGRADEFEAVLDAEAEVVEPDKGPSPALIDSAEALLEKAGPKLTKAQQGSFAKRIAAAVNDGNTPALDLIKIDLEEFLEAEK